MLNKKKLNNYFLILLKQKYLKREIKKYILKSIITNQKLKPSTRVFAQYKLVNIQNNASISKQYNTCFESGKIKSIINKFNRSRQITKKFAYEHKLTNTKISSW